MIVGEINAISTLVVAISTATLAIITYYYAKQTRELVRNEFRPLCFASVIPKQEDQRFSLYLEIKNIGKGLAENLRVEYNVKNLKDSQRSETIMLLQKGDSKEFDIVSGIYEIDNSTTEERDRWLESITKTYKTINIKIIYYDIFGGK